MPIGVIINALSIAVGGISGALIGNKLSENFITSINMIFGVCSMAMGISSIVLMKNMPAVVFLIIIGTALGLAVHLGDKFNVGKDRETVLSIIHEFGPYCGKLT